MPPLPYPHRVSFLAAAMTLPAELEPSALLPARILASVVFDHLVAHPVVSVGDFEDERLVDDDDHLLDCRSPRAEEAIDWCFRVSRRHEVLWLDLSVDPQRPSPVKLRARRPSGPIEEWTAVGGGALSEHIQQVVDLWLESRRLPRAGALPPFTAEDLLEVTAQLARALAASRSTEGRPPHLADALLAPPPRLAVAFYRAMAELAGVDAGWEQRILAIDPRHPAALRNRLGRDAGDPRAILALVDRCPMYGKPHLLVSGDASPPGRPGERSGLRHHGIAASLIPAYPEAPRQYARRLIEAGRHEEAHRWADRATIAAPSYDRAHLDCVHSVRGVQRPGQAFAEAIYRCNDVLQRWHDGRIDPADWPIRYEAGMLKAQVHLDVGRRDEAIQLADDALADLGDRDGDRARFAWAIDEVARWRSDPEVLARSYAREGFHRGEPGRVLDGLARAGGARDDDDVWMELDALIAIGREDLARAAFHRHLGARVVGDGKGRLAGACAEILAGDPHAAMEQIQIVQLRRGQGRLEPEINRLLRLAACRSASDWEAVVTRRLDQGAFTLARRAARDLADFVPDLDRPAIRRALGSRRRWHVEPGWLAGFASGLSRLGAGAATV
jgi:tetratricopeptide (TPR) repeat protein